MYVVTSSHGHSSRLHPLYMRMEKGRSRIPYPIGTQLSFHGGQKASIRIPLFCLFPSTILCSQGHIFFINFCDQKQSKYMHSVAISLYKLQLSSRNLGDKVPPSHPFPLSMPLQYLYSPPTPSLLPWSLTTYMAVSPHPTLHPWGEYEES